MDCWCLISVYGVYTSIGSLQISLVYQSVKAQKVSFWTKSVANRGDSKWISDNGVLAAEIYGHYGDGQVSKKRPQMAFL